MGSIDDLEARIAKTRRRFNSDVQRAVETPSTVKPFDLVEGDVVWKRLGFLAATLPNSEDAPEMLERILFGDELQPINYLKRGSIAANSVARIVIHDGGRSGFGTGFMIAPGVLITNNHVLRNATVAARSYAEFDYELDLNDLPIEATRFEFDPTALFQTSIELDFTVVAVRTQANMGSVPLATFGFIPLIEEEGKVAEGEWMTIIQHPSGERKQICIRENQLKARTDTELWYTTDTRGGSSGSPVFNNDWYVVALHHAGVPERVNGKMQTIDGNTFDKSTMDESNIKYIANAGVRVSRIVRDLKIKLPLHALLQPLFAATAESARIKLAPQGAPTPAAMSPIIAEPAPPKEDAAMPAGTAFPLEFRLRVAADGTASIVSDGGAQEAAFEGELAASETRREAAFDAPFDFDYSKRKGYSPSFLGDKTPVGLPTLSDALEADVAKLLKPQAKNDHILHYGNFSVVMHAKRRLAIYSAANVDYANRYDMNRPRDTWRRDPRIKAEHQLENWYYAAPKGGANRFDRGHLTRREDLEYGESAIDALQSAADTCHWTNCTPQHEKFNQNREVWQGIERYILEQTIFVASRKIRAQVITGPILDESDPEFKKVQYPLQYWKVVAALDSDGKVAATAYVASQAEIIEQFGIESTVPFGQFMHFQTTVVEIERLTGLTFVGGATGFLRDVDPMTRRTARRTRAIDVQESSVAGASGPYRTINAFDDIVL